MSYLVIIVLALVQALTEFLPISSSAHLYLASHFFDHYQGVTFDLGLHLGTLIAVLIYFRRDWLAMLQSGLRWRPQHAIDADQRRLIGIALASIPAAAFGFWISRQDGLKEAFRNDYLIGANLLFFGILMWVAERFSKNTDAPLSIPAMLLIGLAQAIALIPGVSRSGITMTAALLLGQKRENAARFSFLLAVPATAMAVAKGLLDMFKGSEALSWSDFLLGALLSGLFGYVVIHFFLALIRKIGVLPFAIYRVILGLLLLTGLFQAFAHSHVMA
jgi:undecaprenyl-diphosphatase